MDRAVLLIRLGRYIFQRFLIRLGNGSAQSQRTHESITHSYLALLIRPHRSSSNTIQWACHNTEDAIARCWRSGDRDRQTDRQKDSLLSE